MLFRSTAKRQPMTTPIILAYGEVTGHCHQIKDIESVALYEDANGKMFLRVIETAEVTHEEHFVISIPPGMYERIVQREYSPEEIRSVQD